MLYVELRNLVCCRLILFNARRGGKPSRMKIDQWINRKQWLHKDLAEADRQLFREMEITFLTGKGNHLVSCIVPLDCVPALNLLTNEVLRKQAGLLEENKFIFANTEGSNHHVDGWMASTQLCLH